MTDKNTGLNYYENYWLNIEYRKGLSVFIGNEVIFISN